MEITVIGAGAIGGVLGAYLARQGHSVMMCDIVPEHVQKIRTDGLRIEGPEDVFTVRIPACTPDELVSRGQPLQTVLVCVKSQDTETAIRQILSLLQAESLVVSVQNGLCENVIAGLVGAQRTMGCFVNFSADYLEPGRILYGGVSALYLGELDGRMTDRLMNLQRCLSSWGPAQVTDNIWGYLWGKLSYAALLFATALVDETMATVVRSLEYRDTLMELCSEVLETADKEGVSPLGFDDWEPSLVYPRTSRNGSALALQLEKLAERMAANRKTKSGIWRDLAVRKRKTEVEFQLAPIVDIGKRHGVHLPLLSALVEMIREMETGAREMSWANLDELRQVYSTTHPIGSSLGCLSETQHDEIV